MAIDSIQDLSLHVTTPAQPEDVLAAVLRDDLEGAIRRFVELAIDRLDQEIGVALHASVGGFRVTTAAAAAHIFDVVDELVGDELHTEPTVRSIEVPAGRTLGWLLLTEAPTTDKSADVVRLETLLATVLAHHWAFGAARRAATTDSLTMLGNRRALEEALWSAARARDGVWSLLCLDVNGFGGVNAVHGDDVGDEILAVVARRLRSEVRADDLIVRTENDEFVVLCPGLDHGSASALADRVRVAVSDPVVLASATVTVTAAVGVATAERAADVYGLHELARTVLEGQRV